ncbi:MAG: putative membrane protein YfcA [Paracoccaceae bacterium]|jgi:uncharacterized membrane protein YfcA
MDFLTMLLLFVAALIGGGMSAVAGGASFFTFPALLFAGLSPLEANATNFVAMTPGNITALPAFRVELRALGRALIVPSIIGGLGAIVGAVLLLALGGGFFANAVPYLMGTATALFAFAPVLRRLMERRKSSFAKREFGLCLLFIAAVYGGYFGAGLGQIMLAVLILIGYSDLHIANAAKNAINSVISLVAVVIYGLTGAVAWPAAIVMVVGASIGGYFGGYFSRRIPQNVLRWAVISFGVILTVFYFVKGA